MTDDLELTFDDILATDIGVEVVAPVPFDDGSGLAPVPTDLPDISVLPPPPPDDGAWTQSGPGYSSISIDLAVVA